MISMDKKYQTRDGVEVRVLCIDAPHALYPVVFLTCPDGRHFSCGKTGRFDIEQVESHLDLIEILPSVVFWVNVTAKYNTVHPYKTLEEAMEDFHPSALLIQGHRI